MIVKLTSFSYKKKLARIILSINYYLTFEYNIIKIFTKMTHKKYKCPHCKKPFTNRTALKSYEKTHKRNKIDEILNRVEEESTQQEAMNVERNDPVESENQELLDVEKEEREELFDVEEEEREELLDVEEEEREELLDVEEEEKRSCSTLKRKKRS